MKTITVYTVQELKDAYPDSYEKAYKRWAESITEIFWGDDIIESLKGLFKACSGVYLKGWSIGADSQSWIRITFSNADVADISGNRAMAWLENNLLGDLRISANKPLFTQFTLPDGSVTEYQPTKRGDVAKYGKYYRAGMVPPCPFTGVCFDDDFIESLQKDIRGGDTLEQAFEHLAYVASHLMELEWESQTSEEEFMIQEHLSFTEDGTLV